MQGLELGHCKVQGPLSSPTTNRMVRVRPSMELGRGCRILRWGVGDKDNSSRERMALLDVLCKQALIIIGLLAAICWALNGFPNSLAECNLL